MSRSDTRSDDIRSLNPGSGTADARSGIGRHLPSADALKRDARQALNTAEYEFRKVVGASRSVPNSQEADQAPMRDTASRRKQEITNQDAGGE